MKPFNESVRTCAIGTFDFRRPLTATGAGGATQKCVAGGMALVACPEGTATWIGVTGRTFAFLA